jgi:hypothetical protein
MVTNHQQNASLHQADTRQTGKKETIPCKCTIKYSEIPNP